MSWTTHLDGARYLLRIRGKTLLETDTSYQLFNVLRGQIVRYIRHFYIPDCIADSNSC